MGVHTDSDGRVVVGKLWTFQSGCAKPETLLAQSSESNLTPCSNYAKRACSWLGVVSNGAIRSSLSGSLGQYRAAAGVLPPTFFMEILLVSTCIVKRGLLPYRGFGR